MAGHDADTQPPAGLLSSLRQLAATGVAIVRTRLELLANELEEERARVAQMVLLGAIALCCGFIGILLATLLIIVVFWDTHRLAALGILTGAYVAAAVVAAILLRARAARRSKLFSASLAELARDRDLLGS